MNGEAAYAAPVSPIAAAPSASPALTAPSLYAGFWRRVAAYLLDELVLLIPVLLLSLVPIEALAVLLQFATFVAYKVALESGPWQATLGKRALGIKVTDLQGRRISMGRALGRFGGCFLSGIIFGLGFVMAAFTKKRQALHDMLATTLVVNARIDELAIREGRAIGTMPMTTGVWVAVIVLLGLPLILGLVAAIAIPSYQQSTVRSHMSEVITEAVRLKPEAAEEIARARSGGDGPPTRTVAPVSRYVSNVVIDRVNGVIRVGVDASKLGGGQIESGAEFSLALSQDGSQWTCAAHGIPKGYLPATCRQ